MPISLKELHLWSQHRRRLYHPIIVTCGQKTQLWAFSMQLMCFDAHHEFQKDALALSEQNISSKLKGWFRFSRSGGSTNAVSSNSPWEPPFVCFIKQKTLKSFNVAKATTCNTDSFKFSSNLWSMRREVQWQSAKLRQHSPSREHVLQWTTNVVFSAFSSHVVCVCCGSIPVWCDVHH